MLMLWRLLCRMKKKRFFCGSFTKTVAAGGNWLLWSFPQYAAACVFEKQCRAALVFSQGSLVPVVWVCPVPIDLAAPSAQEGRGMKTTFINPEHLLLLSKGGLGNCSKGLRPSGDILGGISPTVRWHREGTAVHVCNLNNSGLCIINMHRMQGRDEKKTQHVLSGCC